MIGSNWKSSIESAFVFVGVYYSLRFYPIFESIMASTYVWFYWSVILKNSEEKFGVIQKDLRLFTDSLRVVYFCIIIPVDFFQFL